MSHPKTRAERRHQRERIIAARRFVYLHIWTQYGDRFKFMREVINPLINIEYLFEKYRLMKIPFNHIDEYPDWGRYAKWNLNCSCRRCRGRKGWGRISAQRRRKLKTADSDWELQYQD
jgi:hypothetical protein